MIVVGRFAIMGDWDQSPIPGGTVRITMPPLGHVFGCGWEPHTQMALQALDDNLKPGMSFAEIGAGSCILSVAAKALGASKVYAMELNPEALDAGRRVIAANKADVELIEGTFPPEEVDLAIVSITTDFIHQHRGKIKAKKVLSVMDEGHVEDAT